MICILNSWDVGDGYHKNQLEVIFYQLNKAGDNYLAHLHLMGCVCVCVCLNKLFGPSALDGVCVCLNKCIPSGFKWCFLIFFPQVQNLWSPKHFIYQACMENCESPNWRDCSIYSLKCISGVSELFTDKCSHCWFMGSSRYHVYFLFCMVYSSIRHCVSVSRAAEVVRVLAAMVKSYLSHGLGF